ncbi:MAG: hypothetical protein WHX52_11820 [Anaerolineae bacterium]
MMKKPQSWRIDVAVIAVYTVLTVAMTWPLIVHLNTHFAGQNIDVWINQWATWWTERALTEGRSLYYTDLMFYPQGVSLAFHSFSHVNSAIAVLLRPWLGDLGAHNFTVLLAHILSGYAMFCLARYVTRSPEGAFFAGLVFAFYPYRMAESVHPVLVSTQWMPLYLLFLIRLVEEGRRRDIIPAAFFALLTALTSWHLLIFTVFISAVYGLYVIVAERHRLVKATWVNLALLVALTAVLLAPFLYPLLREQLSASRSYVGVALEDGAGTDPLVFLLPAEQHPVFKSLVIPWHARTKNTRAAYLGVTVVALSVIACRKDWRRARFWLLLALLSMLLALPPRLQIAGHVFDVVTPWSVPIVWLLRHPFRFNLLVGLGLAVTAGLGFSMLLAGLEQRYPRWRIGVGVGACLLLLFEYLYFPFPLTPAVASPYYDRLAATPATGAILDLPMGRDPTRYYLYYQMLHERPLIEGIVSRTSPEAYTFIEATPVLRALRACGDRALPPVDLSSWRGDWAALGIEAVIVHKDLVPASALALWADMRTSPPDYEDDAIAVYLAGGETASRVDAPQLLEGCMAVRAVSTEPLLAQPGAAPEIALEWIAGARPQEDAVLALALVDERGVVRRRFYQEVVPGVSLQTWQPGKRHVERYAVPLDPLLPAGTYTLEATLTPPRRDREPLLSARVATLVIAVDAESRAPFTTVSNVTDVAYGDDLRLLGYDLESGAEALFLRLRWRAERPIAVDYKFFVHIYAQVDAAPVAQVDTMPQQWTYPTRWWPVGQVVTDEMTVALDHLPSGRYRVGIGVYDPQTGARLAIAGAPAGFTIDNGRLLLPEEIVR